MVIENIKFRSVADLSIDKVHCVILMKEIYTS